ncbi:pantoate--beta-alanine ligase, partial [bacterium]|nr:pantoate--beta-alanine ligase [bacterium]
KVASIPKERMQVYFIDNDEYFKNRLIDSDKKKNLYKDNCKEEINSISHFELEYLELVNNESLEKEQKIDANNSYRIFICVLVNGVRLIDNILVK